MEKYYYYVSVIYDNVYSKKSYYYISNDEKIKIGDKVLVNCSGDKITGKVIKVERFTKEQAPFPVYKTKKVLKILNEEKTSDNKYNVTDIVRLDNKIENDISKIIESNIIDKDNDNKEILDSYNNLKIEDYDTINAHKKSKRYKIAAGLVACFIVVSMVLYNPPNKIISNENKSDSNTSYSSKSTSSDVTNNTSSSYKSSSSSSSSKNNSSYSYKNDPDATVGSGYVRKVGVNGAITYSCTRHCTDSCENCKKCITNQKSFPSSHCTFSYQFSKNMKDKGWIGCPQCGDISYDTWNSFYK